MPKLILEDEISFIDFSQYSYVGLIKKGRPDFAYIEIAEAKNLPADAKGEDRREPLLIAVEDPESVEVVARIQALVQAKRGY